MILEQCVANYYRDTLKEETFAERNFRGFAVFSQMRESLFPRNFSSANIQKKIHFCSYSLQQLFSRKNGCLEYKLHVIFCWIFFSFIYGLLKNVTKLDSRLFLFPWNLLKVVHRESLFPRNVKISRFAWTAKVSSFKVIQSRNIFLTFRD